jgi:hypothetical protein
VKALTSTADAARQGAHLRARSAPSRRTGTISLALLLLFAIAVPGFAVAAKNKGKSNDVDLAVRGLSEHQDGTFADPNGKMTATVKRNAKGFPVKLVDVKISNVDSDCWPPAPEYYTPDYRSTPGPEVSADLGSFALKRRGARHADGSSSYEWRFPQITEVRTIAGVEHELHFLLDDKRARKAFLGISASPPPDGGCIVRAEFYLKKKK